MSDDAVTVQKTLVLTPHPLQRIGACALAALADVDGVDAITPERFDAAVTQLADHAADAAVMGSTKEDGAFWLKASHSFFPNSKMNHPSRAKNKTAADLRAEVRAWRAMPAAETWPRCGCALCGRRACGFYGKTDVPLAESVSYRNTAPPRQDGLGLCFACLCSFYALPYGCQLSGGPSAALHSWDDDFLWYTTRRQYFRTAERLVLGQPTDAAGPYAKERTAVDALRGYDRRLEAGLELFVFSNDNRDPALRAYGMAQPLADWLRGTSRRPGREQGFARLVRAHQTEERSGQARLAYHAFHRPGRILSTAAEYLRAVSRRTPPLPDLDTALVPLCHSYAIEVMAMNDKDISQVTNVARKVAVVLTQNRETGPLQNFRTAHRTPADLQQWFRTHSVRWTLGRYVLKERDEDVDGRPTSEQDEPLVTAAQWRVLFDPDGQSWAYRQLFFIAVLEEMHRRGWRPETAGDVDDEPDERNQDEEHDAMEAQT